MPIKEILRTLDHPYCIPVVLPTISAPPPQSPHTKEELSGFCVRPQALVARYIGRRLLEGEEARSRRADARDEDEPQGVAFR